METPLLDGLGDLSLHLIAVKLGPKDTAILCCVNRRLRDFSSEETLWRTFYLQDLHLPDPSDPSGNPTDSFRVAYKLWRESFALYPWPLVKRVKSCWDRLKNWLSLNFPEAVPTLRKGASEDEIQQLESKLAVKLPLSTKLLYRFCDGQELPNLDTELGSPFGLIGGYCFYDHLVNVYLLPLSQVIAKTKEFVRHLGFSNRSKYIVVASSSTYNEKLFFLNCVSGQIYVGTSNLFTDGEMIPCVSVPALGQRDAMLLWLEEHGRRLETGIVRLREHRKLRRIDLFPQVPPLCSTAVTNGVKIRASAVFVPELTNLQGESEKYWFSYSIHMNLLPEGCTANGASTASCQLYWRHWIIRADDVVVSDINREAVIGQYPFLHPDRREFFYESCTPLPSCSGSIEGAFTFVPGRIIDNRQTAAKTRQKRMRDSLEDEQGQSEKQHIEAQQQLQDQSAQHQQLQMEHLHLQMEHQQLQTNHHQFQQNLQQQLQGQIQLTLLLHDEQRRIAQQLQLQQFAIRQLQQEQLAIRQLQQEHIQSTVRLSESCARQRRLEQQVHQLILIVQQLNQQVHRQQEQQVLLLQHFQQQQAADEVPRGPVTSNTETNTNVGNRNSSSSKEDNRR